MELKGTILEKSGSEVSGIQDAIFNRFLTNFKDGIIQGAYEEARFSLLSSNTLHIAKGEALICGMRVIIEETAQTFITFPRTSTRYQIVLQIQMNELGQPQFNSITREIEALKQQDILNAELTNAVYQVELGRFSLNGDKIEDAIMTLDIIVAGTNTTSQELNIGNITTQKIDISLPAEVDVNNRFDTNQQKYFVDFNFALPVNLQQETIDKIDLSLSNSQQAMNAVRDFHQMEAVVAQLQQDMQTQNTQSIQLQEEITRLKADREQIIKDSWLYAHPIGSCILTMGNENPNDRGGEWELVQAGKALWTTQGNDAGGTIEAGLPNITGKSVDWATLASYIGTHFEGAMYLEWEANNVYLASSPHNHWSASFRFDASRSNPIYGRSNTVQPPAVKIRLWRRIR